MLANVATDSFFDQLNAQLKQFASELCDDLPIKVPNTLIPSDQELFDPEDGETDKIYRLLDGHVAVKLAGRQLFFHEPGELMGLDAISGIAGAEYVQEFAVRVAIYDRKAIMAQIRSSDKTFAAFMAYIQAEKTLIESMFASTIAATGRPHFQIKRFEEGDVIIREGDTDTDVFSMLSGQAEVLVGDKRVGEVHEEEIFGEMSRLTGEPRSATVRALTTCEVMVFGGDDFNTMAETNPSALKDIAKNLSERLSQLNAVMSKS